MIPIQRVLLKFLRILRFVRGYIAGHAGGSWNLLTAFIGRLISELRRTWHRRPGTSQDPRAAEPLLPRNRASSYSASGGSVVLREYDVVAASTVPSRLAVSSTSLATRSVQEDAGQSAPSPTSPTTSIPPTLSVNHPHSPYGRSYRAANSSGNVSDRSVESHASRLSAIVHSTDLLHANAQPPRSPRGVHRHFGPAVDPPASRGQLARAPSPTFHQNITLSDPRLAVTTPYQYPPSQPYETDEGHSAVVHPPSPSSTHGALWPLVTTRSMRSRASSNINLSIRVQSPSTESLPNSLTRVEELTVTDPAHPTPSPPPFYSDVDHIETTSQHSTVASSKASSVTSDFHLPDRRFLQMIHSEQIPRYENATIPRKRKRLILNPLTTTFSYFPNSANPNETLGKQNCVPWKAATHPDGALYFYDPSRRLFTDTDMYNKGLRDEMEEFHSYLEKTIRVEEMNIPSKKNYDLVLDIMPTDNETILWSYYFACHKTRCLFWLDKYDASSEIYGVDSPAHVKHRLEDLYWNHWSLYPVAFKGRRLRPHVYDELLGMLAHGCVDALTSKVSTLPYDDEKMQKMISLVENAKGAKAGLEHYTAGTTRLLCFFAHWRFLYFHGQRHARLLKDRSVYDDPKLSCERSRLTRFLSPLLFFAPEVHLREMKELWTDEIIIEITWKKFMTKLQDEWIDFVLWSTVMLAVNVGFLSIPGVTFSTNSASGGTLESIHQDIILPSSAQIASILSTEASVGSILIGLFLVRHNRTKQDLDPTDASTYLYQSSRRIFGLEAMAIIFSLPWALLLWSMVTFSVALLLLCFVVSNAWTQSVVALTSFPMLAFTLWCLWMCWDSSGGIVPARLESLVESLRIRAAFSSSARSVLSFVGSDYGSSRHASPSNSQGDVRSGV